MFEDWDDFQEFPFQWNYEDRNMDDYGCFFQTPQEETECASQPPASPFFDKRSSSKNRRYQTILNSWVFEVKCVSESEKIRGILDNVRACCQKAFVVFKKEDQTLLGYVYLSNPVPMAMAKMLLGCEVQHASGGCSQNINHLKKMSLEMDYEVLLDISKNNKFMRCVC